MKGKNTMNITKKINSILGDKRSIDYWSSTKSSKEIKHLKKCDSFLETVDERVEKLTKKIKQLNAEAKKISKSRDEYRDLYKASQLQLQTQEVKDETKDISDKEISEEIMPLEKVLEERDKQISELKESLGKARFESDCNFNSVLLRDIILSTYINHFKETSSSYTIKDDLCIAYDLIVNNYNLTKELTTMTSNIYTKRQSKLIEFLALLKKKYYEHETLSKTFAENTFMRAAIKVLSCYKLDDFMSDQLYGNTNFYGLIIDYEIKVIKETISTGETNTSLMNLVEPIFKSMNEEEQVEKSFIDRERELIMLLASELEDGKITPADIIDGKISNEPGCPYTNRYLFALITSAKVIETALSLDSVNVETQTKSLTVTLLWYIKHRCMISDDGKDTILKDLSTIVAAIKNSGVIKDKRK